jgi:hypothetical protein
LPALALLGGCLLGGCSSGDDDQTWSALVAPPQIKMGSDGGIPFLAYDDAQRILYASMFSGGVARMVVP